MGHDATTSVYVIDAGFSSALTAEQIRRLEGLGFTWSVRPEPVTTWNKKFAELKGEIGKYLLSTVNLYHYVFALCKSSKSLHSRLFRL